ncbi:paralemmin-1-like [Poeciliopsis prolifica]|uniref:paralemmin-1-like n=1 Tax=Poeciliopsis prolifica TaxID=188132 RepID=UPI002413CA29|nr:paralemmin-1-like [Poeciliopsis prolifica]XP_054892074.1 paralemmin-1-like [Poeciliopsis prolifica]XP_054892075.1 paralemmin-1-like [Poeciliopsis prolifica]XP_054892076.1 paralemmin-1-like [Poeciliopsis prolifica]
MAQRMPHDAAGQDGRSVLGMLAVQVERDPRTGATVIKSVAPISSPPAAPTSTTIFDDGRKSIHTVGGSVDEPSTEELGEILTIIDDVGMTVLLDDVAATPNKTEITTGNGERNKSQGHVLNFITPNGTSKEDYAQLDNSGYKREVERMKECTSVRIPDKETKIVTKDITEILENMEGQSLEEDPVTLVFLGYTDASPEEDHNDEDYEGMLTAERVIITEYGEEHVVEPGAAASLQSPSATKGEQETQKKTQDTTLQDVPLNDDDAEPQTQREDGVENDGRRKKCRCCSVM